MADLESLPAALRDPMKVRARGEELLRTGLTPPRKLPLWQRLLCAFGDHRGINVLNRCKRCGALVKVSPW